MAQRDGESVTNVVTHNIAPLHQRDSARFNKFSNT
jgi:hypothetical protein